MLELLGLTLLQCFLSATETPAPAPVSVAVLDFESKEDPDVEISGEAFSAFAVRRGNLFSCKARVELKAQGRIDGKIIAVDRETTVAVDIAEQTAAKTALQNAAAELALRLAPKLVKGTKLADNN